MSNQQSETVKDMNQKEHCIDELAALLSTQQNILNRLDQLRINLLGHGVTSLKDAKAEQTPAPNPQGFVPVLFSTIGEINTVQVATKDILADLETAFS
jgi:hypothetical protein